MGLELAINRRQFVALAASGISVPGHSTMAVDRPENTAKPRDQEVQPAVWASGVWLRSMQGDDGSWRFDRDKTSAGEPIPDAGTLDAPNGATALVLLVFFGAGHTHQRGKFHKQVKAGLDFLMSRIVVKDGAGSLEDAGAVRSHAWATLLLCEAFEMTRDKALRPVAQQAVNHLQQRQDKTTGGWPSGEKRPDLVTAAWALLALKSAQGASLTIDPRALWRTRGLLTAYGSDDGAAYGRVDKQPDDAATAAGLLIGMLTGWKPDHPPLKRGIEALVRRGPSRDDSAFNYFATLVCRYDGSQWADWNTQAREQLVASMVTKEGPTWGSWHLGGADGSKRGGRLYDTALSAATLQIYYRHLPIYRVLQRN